jgi:hypothetical protein
MRVGRNGVGDSSKGRKKTVAKVFEKITKRSSGEEEQSNDVGLSVFWSFIIRYFYMLSIIHVKITTNLQEFELSSDIQILCLLGIISFNSILVILGSLNDDSCLNSV